VGFRDGKVVEDRPIEPEDAATRLAELPTEVEIQ
jgi:hypothetical protein